MVWSLNQVMKRLSSRISVFCMGYLVACFYFLLVGGDLLLKPVKSILLYWDCLIGYNVFVITMKNILSVSPLLMVAYEPVCDRVKPFVWLSVRSLPVVSSSPWCWITVGWYSSLAWPAPSKDTPNVRLFIKHHTSPEKVFPLVLISHLLLFPAEQPSSKQCELPSDEAGIVWDGVCFCFLLLQRRVFRSHYFLYVVLDLQNTQLLASR